jgi:hypothetical protein
MKPLDEFALKADALAYFHRVGRPDLAERAEAVSGAEAFTMWGRHSLEALRAAKSRLSISVRAFKEAAERRKERQGRSVL